jgi:hypothetical protein
MRATYVMATGALAMASLGCYNVDKQDVVTKCYVRALTQSWVTAGLDVDVSSPDRCPFPIHLESGRSRVS